MSPQLMRLVPYGQAAHDAFLYAKRSGSPRYELSDGMPSCLIVNRMSLNGDGPGRVPRCDFCSTPVVTLPTRMGQLKVPAVSVAMV